MRDVNRDIGIEESLAGFDLVDFEQRIANVMSLRSEERETHSTADDERVGNF
ncbi:unannotated protein [freshwater metagenome]|uniref:Unannotated protein n=1 Tax=freshwater metagenome TaxID=449393 RepID=A0A6J6EDA1_9ZZZZ